MDEETGARQINSKATLVEATEIAFAEILETKIDSPPEAAALLEAGLVAIRALRDNPAIFDNRNVLMGMQEIVFSITAAAGFTRAVVVQGTQVPPKAQLN